MSKTPSRVINSALSFPLPTQKLQSKLTIEQYYEQIVDEQKQNELSLQQQKNPLKQILKYFRDFTRQIHTKIDQYYQLQQSFKQKVQKDFILTFSKILQKIGNDLMLAEQAYKNIDKDIMTTQKCVNLNQDKIFFVKQSSYYKNELEFKTKQIQKIKQKNYLLIKQNTGLKQKIFQKVKENMFWKQKCKKIQKINHLKQSNKFQIEQEKQHDEIQKQKQQTNQNISPRKNTRKWTSLGKQTDEQRERIQLQQRQKRKNLFKDINKQLKKRDRINLEAIVNRTSIQKDSQSRQNVMSKRIKREKEDLSQTFYMTPTFTQKISSPSQSPSSDIGKKVDFNSTFASKLGSNNRIDFPLNRSIHSSMGRNLKSRN